LSTEYEAPRTDVERALAKIWTEMLGIDKVGIHDNFFELGGDSVLNIQITARANQAGVRLTPKQVFERQTIAELAAIAGAGKTAASEKGVLKAGAIIESDLAEIARQLRTQTKVAP
jgi:aryl carrier-like protein